jgi:hypothetical protein
MIIQDDLFLAIYIIIIKQFISFKFQAIFIIFLTFQQGVFIFNFKDYNFYQNFNIYQVNYK